MTTFENWQWIGLLISITLGVFAIARTLARLKNNQTGVITDTALKLITPLREQIVAMEKELAEIRGRADKLEKEVKALRAENGDFKRGCQRLIYQIKSCNMEPVWSPEETKGPDDEDD